MRRLSWMLTLGLTLAPVGGAVVTAACGDDGGATGATSGKRVALRTRLEAERPGEPFAASKDWTVTLTAASLSIASLYYYDGPSPIARAAPPASSRWGSLWQPAVAWAHPGHYQQGTTRGEMLSPWSVDLFAGAADLPVGDGISGLYRSGQFNFGAPSAGPAAGELGGAAVRVTGLATRATSTVHFTMSVSLERLSQEVNDGHIKGCIFDETDVQSDGTVTITVLPSVWLGYVNFNDVAPGSAEAPTVIQDGEVAYTLFLSGLTQLSAYRFRFAP
ncbi:MAG: hypothetical protein EOO75_12030 [Myxococcales bacterium]|nr:MAG: hypothetical protein EOO75_12030 [Myxococcales bacterium]